MIKNHKSKLLFTSVTLALAEEKTRTIDKIVSNINTQIQTLKEFRKTLINDAVTGKIKVTV